METKRILVVLNTISNQFYSRVVRGIEERAKGDGYSVLLCVTRGNEDNLKEFIKMLETREVDGMILTSREISEADILALSRSCPIVCACEPIKNKKIPLIAIDDEQAGYDAVRFLIKQGKQRIALLGAGKNFYSSTLREKGAKRALSEAGLAPFYISEEGFTYRAGIRSICNLMDEKKNFPMPSSPSLIVAPLVPSTNSPNVVIPFPMIFPLWASITLPFLKCSFPL
jgi:DNA-binding LacI/PurR family transcriptional regulator